MSNTSASGGYLVPSSTAPASDTDFEDILQAMVVGITGLDGTLVRPRWQETPPTQPSAGTNWCAIGVISTTADTYGIETHNPDGDGSDTLMRHATVEILASFYGPNGESYASLLRDGLMVRQNREAMRANGMSLLEVTNIIAAPALINTQWIRKYDLTVRFRRVVSRTYPVLNILSGHGTIVTQSHSQDWNTQE